MGFSVTSANVRYIVVVVRPQGSLASSRVSSYMIRHLLSARVVSYSMARSYVYAIIFGYVSGVRRAVYVTPI